MYVFYHYPCQKASLYILTGILIIPVLLLAVLTTRVTYAADGKAHFSIEPTFFPSSEVSPRPYFIYTSHPTSLIEDSVHVTNFGSKSGMLNLYAVDALTSSISGVAFHPRNDPRTDVGSWIQLSSEQITLNAGQSRDVPFSVSIPDHVRPGQHVGGIVAQEAAQQVSFSKSGSIHAAINIQTLEVLGMLINLPGTLVDKLSATGVTYDEGSTYQRLLIGLDNTGTQLLHPAGSLQVLDQNGHAIQTVPMKLDAILPQTSINYPVYIQNKTFNPGTYKAKLVLNYEQNNSLQYSTSFKVPFLQLQKDTTVSRAIANLLSPNADFLSTLTLERCAVGLCILFIILSALYFWSQKLQKAMMNAKYTFKYKKKAS
jgi:hypothetical protein